MIGDKNKMTTAKERYEEFKKVADDNFEGLRDPITDYVGELEQQVEELLEFVQNIAYNDISVNDLNLDWVQLDAFELLNKYAQIAPHNITKNRRV